MNNLADKFYNTGKEGVFKTGASLVNDTPSPVEHITGHDYFSVKRAANESNGLLDEFDPIYSRLTDLMHQLQLISFDTKAVSVVSNGLNDPNQANSSNSNDVSSSNISRGSRGSVGIQEARGNFRNKSFLVLPEDMLERSVSELQNFEYGAMKQCNSQLFPRDFQSFKALKDSGKKYFWTSDNRNKALTGAMFQEQELLIQSLKQAVSLAKESDKVLEHNYESFVKLLDQLWQCSEAFADLKKVLVSRIQTLNSESILGATNVQTLLNEEYFQGYLDDIDALEKHLEELKKSIKESSTLLQDVNRKLEDEQRTRRLYNTKQARRHRAIMIAVCYTVFAVLVLFLLRVLLGYTKVYFVTSWSPKYSGR